MENYNQYVKAFNENMKSLLESIEDESSKAIISEISPLSENEWKEAVATGLFNSEIDGEAVKKLYEDIVKKYPEEQN